MSYPVSPDPHVHVCGDFDPFKEETVGHKGKAGGRLSGEILLPLSYEFMIILAVEFTEDGSASFSIYFL